MRARVLVVFALLAFTSLVAAGCVTPPTATTPTPDAQTQVPSGWAEKALPWGDAHDHRDWSQHVGLSTSNFQQIAYNPMELASQDGKTPGGYFCGGATTTTDGRRITVISSFDTDVAFVLVDVTDPAVPTIIGEYSVNGVTHYDVDITPDAKYVVIGADPSFPPRLPGLTADVPSLVTPVSISFRDACTGEVSQGPEEMIPLSPATLLVSIKDPKNPTLVDALPAPVLGPHSVSTASIEGVTYVASSITNAAQPADYFQFSQIQELPSGGKLVLLSTVDGAQYGAGGFGGGHVDAEIAVHPVTKKPIAYLSNWDGGMVVLDMTNFATPMLLGEWADDGIEGGAVHSTRQINELWNDKAYLLVGQEFTHHPENRPSGWLYVLDITDPAKPTEVARWTLPIDVDPKWNSVELFSTHYFRVVNHTAFIAMYHGGVWAIDLTNPEQPRSAGVFIPDKQAPKGRDPVGFYDLTPFVLDVFPYEDGTMAIFDGVSGVYTVKYDASVVAPAYTEWPAEGKAIGSE